MIKIGVIPLGVLSTNYYEKFYWHYKLHETFTYKMQEAAVNAA